VVFSSVLVFHVSAHHFSCSLSLHDALPIFDKAVDLVGLDTGLKELLLSTLLDQSRLVLSYNLSSSLLGSLPTSLLRLSLVGLLHVLKLLLSFTDSPLEVLSLLNDLVKLRSVNARVTAGRNGSLSLPLFGLFDLVLKLLSLNLVVDVLRVSVGVFTHPSLSFPALVVVNQNHL